LNLEAVSLDLGNTLLFEVPPRHAIYGEAARSRGRAVSDEAMGRLMKKAHQELPQVIDGSFRYGDRWFQAFIERIFHQELELTAPEVDAITQELFERFENPATFRLYPGALQLLVGVRALGLRLGLTSNWSARLPRLLSALNLHQHFNFVLCSALEGVEKPDPAIFLRAAELAGCPPEDMLHAGDHAQKDGACLEVGMSFCLVDPLGRLQPPPGGRRVADLELLLREIQALCG
jgi:putative hydrolase of the HAD superfamily